MITLPEEEPSAISDPATAVTEGLYSEAATAASEYPSRSRLYHDLFHNHDSQAVSEKPVVVRHPKLKVPVPECRLRSRGCPPQNWIPLCSTHIDLVCHCGGGYGIFAIPSACSPFGQGSEWNSSNFNCELDGPAAAASESRVRSLCLNALAGIRVGREELVANVLQHADRNGERA